MRALKARNFFNKPVTCVMSGLLIFRTGITETGNEFNIYSFSRHSTG